MYSLQSLFDYLLEIQIVELRICRLFCDNIADLRSEFIKLYFNKLKTGEVGPSRVFDFIMRQYTKFRSSNIGKVYAQRHKNRNDDTKNDNTYKKNNTNNKKGPGSKGITGHMDSNTFKKR